MDHPRKKTEAFSWGNTGESRLHPKRISFGEARTEVQNYFFRGLSGTGPDLPASSLLLNHKLPEPFSTFPELLTFMGNNGKRNLAREESLDFPEAGGTARD